MRITSPKVSFALALLVGVLGAWYAQALELTQFVSDDGGITLRYAERIATGHGFNYNDGERVNGASCTLYTLLLAGLMRLGLAPASAIGGLALACFGTTLALLFATFARYWSLFAAVVALALFLATDFMFTYLFDALEPTSVVLLAAALFHALHTRSALYQGLLLGLLVASKLDGALAAIAFTIAFALARRGFPWRIALVALAAALPFFLVLLWCFGTVIPQSALTKVFAHGRAHQSFDPAWISRDLLLMAPLAFAPALLAFVIRVDAERALARNTLALWCLLHVIVYSTIDLGAPYPWYESLPAFLLIVLAAMTAASVFDAATTDAQAAQRGQPFTRANAARIGGVLVLVAFACFHCLPAMLDRLPQRDAPDRLAPSSADELGRLATGAWLRKHTSGTELLVTGYGLPAFEYKGPVYDLALLNSQPDANVLERAQYLIQGPYEPGDPPARLAEERFELAATFQFGAGSGLYAVYAAPESEIGRQGLCHLRVDLLAQPAIDATTGAPLGAGQILINKQGLFARVPSDIAFDVRSRCAPTFAILPEVRSGTQREIVQAVVRIDGEEVLAQALEAGVAGTQRHFTAKPSSTGDAYRLELAATSDGTDARAPWILWGQLEAWAGAALAREDFSLMSPLWARRIESIERPGAP